jgi:CMP-N-acetylneuraminic acid synthetase
MNILGIIPARGGSKGIPYKNIKLLDGKPLIQYTTEIALASKMLSKVIVSSEDEKIVEVAENLGVEVPFVRPTDLAKDNSPTLPVIIHALEFYKKQGVFFDAVCLLQVTTPFRTVAFLDEAIQKFIQSQADSLVSVLEIPHEYNPHWAFEVKNNTLQIATGEKDIIPRRQDLPKAYHRDGSIYITKTDVLLHQKSLFGEKINYIVSDQETYVNIDEPTDWEKATRLISKIGR